MHRHKWLASAVTPMYMKHWFYSDPQHWWKEPITEVLYVCTVCKKNKTEDLDGHWTLEQVRGQ